jgi:hypothetical protein
MFLFSRPVVSPRNITPVGRGSLALLLVVAVLSTMTIPAFASTPKSADPDRAKQKVEKLGVGEHVAVKRVAGKTLHGHITAIGEQSFKLHADNEIAESEIAYNQVLNVKKNPGPIGWMLLGAVVAVVIIVAVVK